MTPLRRSRGTETFHQSLNASISPVRAVHWGEKRHAPLWQTAGFLLSGWVLPQSGSFGLTGRIGTSQQFNRKPARLMNQNARYLPANSSANWSRNPRVSVTCSLKFEPAYDQLPICPRRPLTRLRPSKLTITMITTNATSSIPWL